MVVLVCDQGSTGTGLYTGLYTGQVGISFDLVRGWEVNYGFMEMNNRTSLIFDGV